MPRPACPKCKERQCSRKKRDGLWQRFILSRLGWYPWQCTSCRKIFLVKERGKSKRKAFVSGQTIPGYKPVRQAQTLSHEEVFEEDLEDE